MRQSADSLSMHWHLANKLLDELSRMVALTTQLSKKASREKMAAVSEEKKILELLIGKCEDCILELKDSCQHASSNTDLWHTKITSLMTRLDSSTKSFKLLEYKFDREMSKINRSLNSPKINHRDEEINERITGNLAMSSLMLESQISVAEDTLASMERQHNLLQLSARRVGFIKRRLKESSRMISTLLRQQWTDQMCLYAGMVLVLIAMFLMWLFLG